MSVTRNALAASVVLSLFAMDTVPASAQGLGQLLREGLQNHNLAVQNATANAGAQNNGKLHVIPNNAQGQNANRAPKNNIKAVDWSKLNGINHGKPKTATLDGKFAVPNPKKDFTIKPGALNGIKWPNAGNANNNNGNNNGGNNNGGQPDWKDIVDAVGNILHGSNQGHHHNHGNNHHVPNGHWYPGHVRPGPVVVYPTPVIPGNNSGSVSNAVPSNVIPSNALPNTSEFPQQGTIVVNPQESGGAVGFTIDGVRYELQPGYRKVLNGTKSRVIRFDRGGDFGIVRYTLTNGVYEFRVGEKGWNVVRKAFKVNVVNSTSTDFRYVANGKLQTLKPGVPKLHESRYPVIVGFDRGDGGKPEVIQLTSGTYEVGINPATGLWDLMKDSPQQVAVTTN